MALNQDVQERLHQEIKSIFNDQGEIEYDQMIKNSYLDAFITETLRMFDPAIRLERKADEEYTLEGKDITIPKGGLVYIPVYAIHHDAQFYPQPEKFDPTRFLPENRHKLTPYTYCKFWSGLILHVKCKYSNPSSHFHSAVRSWTPQLHWHEVCAGGS